MVMSITVPIKIETLKAFADEARRIDNVDGELSTDEMLEVFSRSTSGMVIPDNARLYYVGNAESVLDMGDLILSGNAMGEVTE